MIRVRRWVGAAVVGAAGLGLTACNNREPSQTGGPGPNGPAAQVNVGAPLYPAAAAPVLPPPVPDVEPIVVSNAVVQSDVHVQVPAQVDALIELIATPLEPGAPYDPNDPDIVTHPRNPKLVYRRVRENDLVRKDQILARLDEQLVALQKDSSERVIKKSAELIAQADKAVKAYEQQRQALDKLTGSSLFERLQLEATVARLQSDLFQSEREKLKAEGEYQTANAQLVRYFVRSPINGRVVKLMKSPQEFAKAGEAILEIQATDRVRVEGKLDAQYAEHVRRGMKATVEPARLVGPEPTANYHRQEVTSVAVTAHDGRPLIVSGGLDGSALVWDAFGTKQSHRLPHPAGVGVRTVAATGKKAKKNWVATGGDDGKVRLWDLSNPDRLPKEPTAVLDEAHSSAVTAAAFSPDGRFLATAAGRDVFVWDVESRKKLYALPAEHRDAVTTVRFTPQTTLVTASRDKSIRVWKLGESGAAAQSVIDHRGGAVDVLGVSSDGAKVLFDKDPNRLDVVSLADERSVGTLQSAGGGNRFATLALFSADDSLILTAGGDAEQRGELILWAAPQPGGRGAEKIRLVTPRGAAVTCAAFSPDPEKRFMVVGTADGGVYYWTAAAARREKPLTGEVVSVLPADARSFTVRVELPNPTDQWGEELKDRSLATIIILPDQTVPAPQPPAADGVRRAAATGTGPGSVVPAVGSAPATGPAEPGAPPVAVPPVPNPPSDPPAGGDKKK